MAWIIFDTKKQNVDIVRILASLGSVLVHYFAAIMLLYFSVELWMSYTDGTYVTVYQSSLVLSTKVLKVEFGPENRSLMMCLS